MFQIFFHLPYYAWREQLSEDQRRYKDGQAFRRCEDVSFLSWKTSDSPGYLHEAQISCVVAGLDDRRWVAYCFVDTYFDGEGRETVLQYHEESVAGGELTDPLTYGVNRPAHSIQDPEEYFLIVFRIRLNQVKREWQKVVGKLKQSIRENEPVCSISILNSCMK